MKLREAITVTALLALICAAYSLVQTADAEAAQHEQEVWTGKVDK